MLLIYLHSTLNSHWNLFQGFWSRVTTFTRIWIARLKTSKTVSCYASLPCVYSPPPPFLFRSHSDYWLTRLCPLLNQHNKTNKQGKHTNKRKKTNKQKSEPKKQTNKQKWQKKEKIYRQTWKKKKKPGITCFIPSLFF